MKKTFILLALGFGLVAPAALHAQEEAVSFVKEYKIGPKGLLEITVFELPELNQTVRVSEDGAKKSGIRLKRKDRWTGKETEMKVNLGDIIKGKKRDIELQEGDAIIVPESIW